MSGDSLERVVLRKPLMELGDPRGRPRRVMPVSHVEKGMF